ncbi:hypothetical protein [Fulvivirga sedimenti]|uniref:Outer membrane protein beta-barrel domain-containing protein n=1 Tax=Fulvivirga sedimenti TaxID=2879465 RepID=A0A9X1KW75_9BACT|nr:hypothetical protein [Fulvivirga sedimenti]MCA6073684.1 hypothetical protein [Fulvivirga sedimenti]
MKKIVITALIFVLAAGLQAQSTESSPATPATPSIPAAPSLEKSDTVKVDTVVIEVGKSSILFIIRDKKDLEKLQTYDLNKIVDDLQLRLDPEAQQQVIIAADTLTEMEEPEVSNTEFSYEKPRGLRHYFNIDLGFNNYLGPDGFPDESNAPYTVRPWGSWYVALGSVNEAYLSRGVSLQFGANLSWYNFKFQNDAMYVIREADGVDFVENPEMLDANFKKSKLTVAYINASLVPVFHFGRKKYRDGWRVWDHGPQAGFRLGAGAYAGYRIGSYSKVKYSMDGTEKRKDHDSFYLENFRYGVRVQLGFGDTDIFFNYDLNNLFQEGNGPELNAFSFGIIF